MSACVASQSDKAAFLRLLIRLQRVSYKLDLVNDALGPDLADVCEEDLKIAVVTQEAVEEIEIIYCELDEWARNCGLAPQSGPLAMPSAEAEEPQPA